MDASLPFLGFSLAVVLAYNASRSSGWRQSVLLLANVAFLATFSLGIRAYLPFAAFLLLGYLGVQLIRRYPRQAFVPVLMATIIGFVWLKKYAFVPSFTFLHIAYLTVGLSYIFFRVLHLMIDTHSGELPGRIGLASYLNYTTNFTTLVSGPIQLYPDFKAMPGLSGDSRLSFTVVAAALERILRGVLKTNVLALVASTLQHRAIDVLLTTPHAMTKVTAGAMVFALYPIFLYCNFSGYIDIVIGIGNLLGFKLPENFNRPFSALNFIDFWSRWHITLSQWLKTYVFNPMMLSLMRRFPSIALEPVWAVLAFFVTFFLIGVWHGQTSEFLFFGVLQGLGVSVNKLYQIVVTRKLGRAGYKRLAANPAYRAGCRGLTFTWFAFTLIWFWSNWQQIHALYSRLGLPGTIAVWLSIFIVATVVLAACEETRQRIMSVEWDGAPAVGSIYARAAWNAALLVMVVAIALLARQSAPDIVYKAF